MASFSNSIRLHLWVLTRSTDHSFIPQPPRARPITTGRHRAPTFPRPPPARRVLKPVTPLTTAPQPNDPLARRPTNRQIPFSHVYVIDPSTNKLSATKQRLEDLLVTRERRVVELVASVPKPIVRLTTRDEVEARYKAMRRASRAGGEAKEVQFTWGVAPADVEHKMRKARRDLEKGYPVVVAVAMKRGHRPSSQQELVAFGDGIAQALDGVGEECKEREITQRSMVLSFRKVGDAS